VIGKELLQILAATPESMVVDLAAHSLGTSLALQAYSMDEFGQTFAEMFLDYATWNGLQSMIPYTTLVSYGGNPRKQGE